MGQLFQFGIGPELLRWFALMRLRVSCAMGVGPSPDGLRITAHREPVSTATRALRVDGALDGGCRQQCSV